MPTSNREIEFDLVVRRSLNCNEKRLTIWAAVRPRPVISATMAKNKCNDLSSGRGVHMDTSTKTSCAFPPLPTEELG